MIKGEEGKHREKGGKKGKRENIGKKREIRLKNGERGKT